MSNYGSKIAELRKKAGLTQSELGKQLNMTSQAVSKWENGLSEPDLETIHQICNLFNVSVDEFLEVNAPKKETKPKTAKKTTKKKTTKKKVAKNPEEEITEEQETETPPAQIFGYCEKCSKPVGYGEYKIMTTSKSVRHGRLHHTETETHVYCNDCYAQIQHELQEQQMRESKERYEREASEDHKSFTRGLKWGTIAAIIMAIIMVVNFVNKTFPVNTLYIVIAVLSVYGIFALVSQCFWLGAITEILLFFCRSFKMPGVIFSLDLDGIISLICIKLTLSILSIALSILLFLIGVVISGAIAIFTFPFSCYNNKA